MGNVASFTVSYEGKALESHAMDVRDLGPALLSFGQLFDEANRALNGDKVTIKLQVKATKEGSFNIEFEAIQSLASQISDFLNGEFVTSALNLKELILGSAGIIGLLGLIKKLKGGKPKEIKNLENDHVRILTADGTSIEVPFKSLSLYQQVNVRVATEKVLKPLENEGIDVFSVRDEKGEIEVVDKSSYEFFKAPQVDDEKITEKEYEAAYSIVSLTFKEENKWRLYDGGATINVAIKDEKFMEKINDSLVSFAKGDILICRVKVTQWNTNDGLKTEYEVLEVKAHKSAARQIPLLD